MTTERGYRIVLTTLPDREAAEALVRTLVEERHAACGNILPGLSSIYWWKGEVQASGELLVILKTTAERLPTLLERGPELHPYDVPEFVALPVEGGHPDYLAWIAEETGGGTER